jgi:hypothetical protein
MRAADRPHACFGQSEVLDLAFPDEVLHRAGNVLDGYVRIDAVLIEEIDAIGLQPLERGLGDLSDVFRAAIEATLLARLRIEVEPEFGGDHHLLTERREGFADEFFVRERAIHFGGVKECDAALDGRSDQRDTLLFFDCRAVAKAQTHAAKPDGRDFQVAVS